MTRRPRNAQRCRGRPRASATGGRSESAAEEHLRWAERLAGRLCVELRYLLDKLGPAGQSPRALARLLGVDFNCCREVIAAVRLGAVDPVEFYRTLPAPASLTKLADAMLRSSGATGANAPIHAAIADLGRLVEACGGSYAKLRLHLASAARRSNAGASSPQTYAIRRSMQKLAAEFMGHNTAVIVNMMIVRPIPGQETHTELIAVNGMIGLESHGAPIPLVFRNLRIREQGRSDERIRIRPLDDHDHSLVSAFSSPELGNIGFESRPGSARDTIVVPAGRPFDLVMATRSSPEINRRTERGVAGHMAFMRRPTRRLVLDCYLHRDLADGHKTTIAAYAWHPGLQYDPVLDKDDELPTQPRLELLGDGLARAATTAWRRHADLTAHIFALAGWNPQEFRGYRCDEPMPLWNSVYIMTFDYR